MCIYVQCDIVYKNQLSRQTGNRNLTGPKMLPTIWYTYMTLVAKYQISAINSYWEKCDEKYLGRTEGQTDRGKPVYPPPPSGSRGIKIIRCDNYNRACFIVYNLLGWLIYLVDWNSLQTYLIKHFETVYRDLNILK